MGFYDRGYSRPEGDGRDSELSSYGMMWILIGINVLMYLIFAAPGSGWYTRLALTCAPGGFQFFQLLTAGFLHADFSHILFNMWGLYLFGGLVVPYMRAVNLAVLYVVGVLSGNLIFLVFNWGQPAMLVGASGAVCAVMMAAAMLEPDRKFVMLFLPFTPLKTSTLVVCYTILEVLMEMGRSDGVAHLAHLGGFLGGYIFIKMLFGRRVAWDPLAWRPGKERITGDSRTKNWSRSEYRTPGGAASGKQEGPVSSAELDALLDKISSTGINSLTEYELSRLKRAREEMRGGR